MRISVSRHLRDVEEIGPQVLGINEVIEDRLQKGQRAIRVDLLL